MKKKVLNVLTMAFMFVLLMSILNNCKQKEPFTIKQKVCIEKKEFSTNRRLVFEATNALINKDIISYYDAKNKKLNFSNIFKDSIILTIPLNTLDTLFEKQNPNLFFPCYIQNFDSIYFIDDINYVLYRVNQKGEIDRKWMIDKITTKDFYINLLSSFSTIYVENNLVYIAIIKKSIDFLDSKTFKNTFDSPTFLISDMNYDTLKFSKSCGNYPVFYQSEYYHSDPPSTCIDKKGRIVFSFDKDNNIYVYQKDALVKIADAKSKFANKFNKFDFSKNQDMNYLMKYISCEARYTNIYYDFNTNKYYRIFEHAMEQYNSENKKNEFQNKEWSIIILDETFKKIKEIEINPKNYPINLMYFLPTSKGLLLLNKQEKDSKENCYSIIDVDYE